MSEKKYTILPADDAVQNWFEENIDKECSASSAIYKFRLWLESLQDVRPAGPVWVKASERLPGWDHLVEWRNINKTPAGKDTVAGMIHRRPVSIHLHEWLDESAVVTTTGWLKGKYDKLYDQVKGGKRTVCWVAVHDWPYICACNPETLEFGSAGHSFGYPHSRFDKTKDERQSFIDLCKELNVEWLCESPAEQPVKPYDDLYRLVFSNLAKLRARTQNDDRMLKCGDSIRKIVEDVTNKMLAMPDPERRHDPWQLYQSTAE